MNFVIQGRSSGSPYISIIFGNTNINNTITAAIVSIIIIIGYSDAFLIFALISWEDSRLSAISSKVCTILPVISVDLISSISSELKKYDSASIASAKLAHSVNLSIISLIIKSNHLFFSHCWRALSESRIQSHAFWETAINLKKFAFSAKLGLFRLIRTQSNFSCSVWKNPIDHDKLNKSNTKYLEVLRIYILHADQVLILEL